MLPASKMQTKSIEHKNILTTLLVFLAHMFQKWSISVQENNKGVTLIHSCRDVCFLYTGFPLFTITMRQKEFDMASVSTAHLSPVGSSRKLFSPVQTFLHPGQAGSN